jgi:hypothetical protein
MTVWGISVHIERGNPVVVGVELTGSAEAPTGRETLVHRCEMGDVARALLLLANDLDQELKKVPPSVVVIRAMDWFQARREKVARPRLQVEGVLLAVARRHVPLVKAYSGLEISRLLGSDVSKGDIEDMARRLLSGLDHDAAVAGLGAMALAGRD